MISHTDTLPKAARAPIDPAEAIVLQPPPIGETVLSVDPGMVYRIASNACPVSGIMQDGGDLLIAFEGSRIIRLQDYLIFLVDEASLSPGLLIPESVLSTTHTLSGIRQSSGSGPFLVMDAAALREAGIEFSRVTGATPVAGTTLDPFDDGVFGTRGLWDDLDILLDAAFRPDTQDSRALETLETAELDHPASIVALGGPDADRKGVGIKPVAMGCPARDTASGSAVDMTPLHVSAGSDPLTSISFLTDLGPVFFDAPDCAALLWVSGIPSDRVLIGEINGRPIIRVTLRGPKTLAAGVTATYRLMVEQFDTLSPAGSSGPATIKGPRIVGRDANGVAVRADVTVTVKDGREPSVAVSIGDVSADGGYADPITVLDAGVVDGPARSRYHRPRPSMLRAMFPKPGGCERPRGGPRQAWVTASSRP